MKTFREYLAEGNVDNQLSESKDGAELAEYNLKNIGKPLVLDSSGNVDKNKIVLEIDNGGWFTVFEIKSSSIVSYAPNGKKSDIIKIDKSIVEILTKIVK